MNTEYGGQSKKCPVNCFYSPPYNQKRRDRTYGYCRDQEITIKMPPPAAPSVAPSDPPVPDRRDEPSEMEGLYGRGLFNYKKWWEYSKVDIFVGGEKLTGIPIFTEKNTLRVINDDYSYFIPLEKVDYIRTADGLVSGFYSESADQA